MAQALELWEAVLLGIVQGLTEWLPVSSSGHLVLSRELLGLEAPLFFDLLVHLGTLLVVLVFYRRELACIIAAWLRWPAEAARLGGWAAALRADEHRWLGLLVVIGTVPAVVVGFTFRDTFESMFGSLFVVGIALVATGVFLFLTRFAPSAVVAAADPARPSVRKPLLRRHALLVGSMQALAIIPGVSRSGSTIGTGLLLGWDRDTAARYSFLLSIPAILGATVLQATPEALADARASAWVYLSGFLAAVVVGYVTLWALVQVVRRGGFQHFSYYCVTMGVAAIAWTLHVG